ncbi:phosphatidylinositol-4- kinase, partial [Coelomomyces lativittatus]
MRSRLIAKLNNELCLISSELSPSVSASEIWEPVGNLIASVYKFYLFQEDRLAHEILFSALKAASVSSQAPEALYHLLKKAFETIHTLVVDIAKGENIEDLVEKWLPALIGMLKALSDSCLLMSPETFLLSWNSLQTLTNEDLLDQLSDCLNNLNVNPELTPYRRRLSRNSFDRHPFSPEVLQLRCVTFLRNSIAVYLYNSIPCNESTPTPFYSKKTESTNTHLSIINNSISPFQSASNTPSFHPLRTSLQFNKIWSSLCQIKNHLSPFNAVFPVDELNAFVNYAYENLLAKLRQFHPSHSIPTVILYLQTSTLAWTLSSLPFDPLVKSIFSVFDIEKNPSIDCIPLFEVAASCLILISFTATCPTSLKTKIHNFSLDLLTVPHTAFSLGTAPSISKLRLALSQVLAATCHFLPQLSSSAIYSLIRNASGKLNQVQFENCCTALAVMACELQTPSILDTVLPFFMRTLSSTPNLASMSTMTVSSILTDSGGNSSLNQLKSEATDSSAPNLNANMPNSLFKMSFSSFDTSNCLRYLVNIALDAPLKNFLEVIPFFSEYARQHIGNGPISEIIVECVYRMEERASHTKKRVVLHVLLSFFIDKAAYQLIHGNTNLDELGKLLQLISKVCSVIESQKRHSILEALSNLDTKEDSETSSPKSDSTLEMNLANGSALKPFEKKFRQKLEASQKYASSRLILPSAASFLPLFRSLWYFIVIFDMLSNETMLDTVVDIAAQTPKLAFTLVPENYFQTPAHKTRLLQLLPSCAHLINPLSTEECLYLLTQYHIMCCTASDAELHVFCHLEDMVQYKTMFPVFIPLVELVMSQFFFHKKASKQLSTMIGQLLSGIEYPHPQISSTCLSLLRKLFQKHAYLLYEKEFFTMTLECALKTPEKSLLIDLKKWIQTAYINSVVVLLSVYIIENEEFETSTFISCLTSQPQLLNKFHWTLSKLSACMAQIEALNVQNLHNEVKHFPTPSSLFKLAVALIRMNGFDRTFFKSLISLPFAHFNLEFLKSGTIAWHTLLYFQHGSEFQFLILLERNWQRQLLGKLGLYNTVFPILDPLRDKVQYSVHKSESSTSLLQELECMCYLIEFLEHLLGTVEELPDNYFQILQSSLSHEMMTSHEASRTARFLLLSLVLQASQHDSCTPAHSKLLIEKAFNCSLKWFTFAPQLACHSPQNVLGALKKFWGLAQKILQPQFTSDFPLLTLLIASESEQIRCWCDLEVSMDILPPQPTSSAAYWKNMVRIAFQYHPSIAVHLLTRFPAHSHLIQPELQIHVKQNANSSTLHACPLGLFSLLTEENLNNDIDELLYIIYWDPLPPIQAMTLFQAKYKYHPLVIQYAFRSLFSVPIQSVLFYIPQLVQLLRHDPLGYVMEYILHAAKTSPIFAHQIIWNMKANMYHDEAGNEPDPLRP